MVVYNRVARPFFLSVGFWLRYSAPHARKLRDGVCPLYRGMTRKSLILLLACAALARVLQRTCRLQQIASSFVGEKQRRWMVHHTHATGANVQNRANLASKEA